ncbi:ABC transporter substrate-binding protein [Xylophilus sp.]|uniref:ABC transporter substrate-binding protein n=1 Tax=Xylophilus sp. TaxID=2653893 RepID=UPI0013B6C9D5|nr:ABC transporter substrate-binding protein [Xylophilus sp.]KAF1044197.1 MAG: putative aliphatic sulfonates-binding protein [Xylophilus sp.]
MLKVCAFKGDDSEFIEAAGAVSDAYTLQRIPFASSMNAAQALAAGAIDAAAFSSITPVFMPPGAPIRQVAYYRLGSFIYKVLVPPGSPIQRLAQLKGARVGYMRAGPLHLLLLNLLDKAGLRANDVQAIALTAQDATSAFVSGHLDVLLAGMYSTCFQAEKAGGTAIATGRELPGFDGRNGSVVAVHEKVLADPAKTAALRQYLAQLQKVWRWIDAAPGPWSERIARITGATPDYVLRNRTREPGTHFLPPAQGMARQQAIADVFARAGVIRAGATVAPLWEPSFSLPAAS